MAESNENQTTNPDTSVHEGANEHRLKHLDFVEVAAECGVVFLSSLYEFSKENSFLLKPVFLAAEGIVSGIMGPICERFHDVPYHILEFLDRKVDEFIYEVDWQHAPVQTLVGQIAHKAFQVAHELAIEIHQTGLPDATLNAAKDAYYKYKPAAKDLFYKYEPVAEDYALWAWWWINRLPIVSHMAQKTVSNATFWAERYNQVVDLTAERGYGWATHMPVIPVRRVEQVLAETAHGGGLADGGGASERDSTPLAY